MWISSDHSCKLWRLVVPLIVNPASSVHQYSLGSKSQVHPRFYAKPSHKIADNCRFLLALVSVQAVYDRGAFDFRAGHAKLYFAECRWADCHGQQPARFHRPYVVYRDQHELPALMCHFILNCWALLEIHICHVAFVSDTIVGFPSQQPVHFRYRNRRRNAQRRIQHSYTLPSALLAAFDPAHNDTDRRADGRVTGKQVDFGVCFMRPRGCDTRSSTFLSSEYTKRCHSKTMPHRTHLHLHFMLQIMSCHLLAYWHNVLNHPVYFFRQRFSNVHGSVASRDKTLRT
jgi:hypothetical protein